MTDCGAAVSDLHIANRFFARLNAVEPVLVVVAAANQAGGSGRENCFQQGWIRSFSLTAGYVNPAPFADEFGALPDGIVALSQNHGYAIVVAVLDARFHGDFEPFHGMVFKGSFHLRRTRIVAPQTPLRDIEVVGPEVGHLAARIIPEEAEIVMHPLQVVGAHGRWPKPQVVIKFSRWHAVGHGRPLEIHAGNTHFNGGDFAKQAVAYPFARVAEIGCRALLAARLNNAAIFARGIHHRPAFSNCQAEWLFTIHVFARGAGIDGHARMPVVWRGDNNRVDIFAVQNFAVVLLGDHAGAGLFHHSRGFCQSGAVHIANAHRGGELHQSPHVAFALTARANKGHAW